MKLITIAFFALLFFAACTNDDIRSPSFKSWSVFNGNYTSNKYSSLTQIDTANVQQLQVAWEYHSGDGDTAAHSQIQCSPIMVNGLLYGTSPQLKLFALDAATGKAKWVFSPFETINGEKRMHFVLNNNRGVTYWSDGKEDQRIFYAAGPYMHAVDANTGKLITSFGDGGKIDLHDGLEMEAVNDLFVTSTSPPAVYKDVLITGTRVSEGMDAAPGHIRGYDVRTGKIKWIFHTIPHPGEPGYETWEDADAWKKTGGANNWPGMTIDQERGIAFIPTGSAAMDFYGGKRLGSNLYANCMLALNANTGKKLWHFQYIHHDTWDWDPSSAPVLLTVNHGGKNIDAVAQTLKTGFVYVFNRETGESLFPVKEVPVDTATKLTGEKLWPTQPFPQKPAPFVRQSFTEKDINPYLTKEEYDEVKQRLKTINTGKMFIPHSKEGTITFPGLDGGAEWGGPAVDPETAIIYINANQMPWILKMFDVDKSKQGVETLGEAGRRLYRQNCMGCHGPDRKGSSNYPSLIDINKRYDPRAFVEFINTGRRMMPAFKHLSQQDKEAVASFVLNLAGRTNKKIR